MNEGTKRMLYFLPLGISLITFAIGGLIYEYNPIGELVIFGSVISMLATLPISLGLLLSEEQRYFKKGASLRNENR